ncbi:MAG TPA: glutamate 5-kinase [Hydrogenophaga sp.]|jgi:glutamate 5-kinase|uniref:glutamate 5-kinase n=1 Tax=Hydrogenophaga sp. TaxID=1904254 RepID=UPI0008C335AD|nr:glutamate 5-kinase [Hydrogenophaga sp.]MBU4183955.1 glutamate 5-kinase [Gammaproteobacteria bacterium]MBW8469306.1 glutamate 5-kinase [Thiobacillus sp.]OGA74963.1 MAG: glutamate 5-kinase [Burkholderiales bacterium GWE1_65_30]OGA90997.1 MAG: glutamate 5-kinase [Burkholderiales bacterium GWF1_66_17]OGB29502.1 MAG: glutamate 5-kinase [Burkholderiales bacterium RIFCSPLOWO2_02_FULL_66_35]OGB34977.1 MAG: glutamate 5-kinase [Burkholderiales bacterium RIFCSPHIGHO2_02_FULL_66_10]PKO74438.1 MAG: gl
MAAVETRLNPSLDQSGVFKSARRIVVKVGSSLVTNEGRGLDEEAIGQWSEQLAALVQQGLELIMVSSGAVAEGMKRLGWSERPKEINELQAAAAVGQMGLVQMYESKLSACGVGSAQVLLTHADLADRERYLNARSTLLTLLQLGVVPVINENDTVVNDEIKFGDNDTLGALVANLVEADVLVILTDQKGLYTADPRRDPSARFVDLARAGDPELETMAGGAGSGIGKGGMITKILAAKRAAGSGASTVIAWGREPQVLLRLCAGEAIGTCLVAGTPKNQARKRWMADHLQLRGSVRVDDGAVQKILGEGKSLLPIGMTAVEGEFSRGDVIAVRDGAGQEIARGLANYASSEARLLCRKSSNDFERLLGYVAESEMIHRDNLVLSRS